jgi:methylenetetrahydrofolate reductase (NADPH)
MQPHPIHPNWDRPAAHMMDGYSLEMTAKDRPALDEAADLIAADTPIAVTFLPGEEMDDRVAAAVRIRELGFEPMPHLSARRIFSEQELATMMQRLTEEAGAKRVFLVAGDPPEPAGPFSDALQMIRTGIFESNGISAVGIAGHPEGHPNLDPAGLWQWMEDKMAEITARGMAPLVVTQFGFDPDAFLQWLVEMRRRGIDAPVRIGVPGPAGIKRLLRYAKFCGVGASTAVLKKYGISLANLLGSAGPDKLVDALRTGFGPEHGRVRLHFYPFGGLKPTVEWINRYAARHGEALPRYDLT